MCIREQANIDRQARKLDELKAAPHAPGPQGKLAKQKKVDKLDKAIRGQMAKELGGVKLKQALVVGALVLDAGCFAPKHTMHACMHKSGDTWSSLTCLRLQMGAGLLVVFKLASALYSGHAVAKLPFAPFSLLAKLTQRGIEKAAIDDCSMAFIYALCQAGVRPSISKLLDWGLSRRMLELSNAHAQVRSVSLRSC